MAETLTPLTDENGTLQIEALLEQVYGIAAIYGGVQQDAQDLLNTCGGGEVVAWLYEPETTVPDLALVRQGNHYYLWVAGTVNLTQWAGNVVGAFAVQGVQPGIFAHGFFWKVAQALLSRGQQYLPPLTPDLKLTLVGHSMGAACAYAMWYQIRSMYPASQVELLQLCSPKLFTNGLQNPSPGVHLRVRMNGDPVPLTPPSSNMLTGISPFLGATMVFSQALGWTHYGTGYMLSNAGALSPDEGDPWFDSFPTAWLLNMQPSQHVIPTMAAALEQAAGV